jgi:predicted RNase H-like HicB family nuclease
MRKYIAVIHKDPERGYGVTFPDFPGLIAFAAFLEGAPDVAASHLTIHLDEIEQGGRALPEPRLKRSPVTRFMSIESPPSR